MTDDDDRTLLGAYTTVRPDAVHALIRYLWAYPLDKEMSSQSDPARREVGAWIYPGADSNKVDDLRTVAEILGCVEPDTWVVPDNNFDDIEKFQDQVHKACMEGDNQASLADAYASLVVLHEQDKLAGTRVELGDALRDQLVIKDERGKHANFNTTKIPAWLDWLDTLGLIRRWPGMSRIAEVFPDPTRRLQRVVRAMGTTRQDWPAEKFLEALAERAPYVDSGVLFRRAQTRAGWNPSDQTVVSRVLSRSLRRLETNTVLEIKRTGSDARDVRQLDYRGKRISFNAIRITDGGN